ncbi:uncharacterized protein LOC120329097 [Styela clava]
MNNLTCFIGLALLGLVAAGGVGSAEERNLCEILVDDECYWTEVHEIRDVNYTVASTICKTHRSVVAAIHTEEAYNQTMANIRSKIPPNRSWTVVWTGMKINSIFNHVLTPDVYISWFPGLPWDHKGAITKFTHIYLEVKRMENSKYQGMLYREGRTALRGVVCRKN